MTLLITCLLIYSLGLAWGWYVAAFALWLVHLAFLNAGYRERDALEKSNSRLAAALERRDG
jgi:hypothetical protein